MRFASIMRGSAFTLALSLVASAVLGQAPDTTGIPRWSSPPTRTLADTVRIIALLDSARAWVGRGETEKPVPATDQALELIDGIARPNSAEAWLDVRIMQANKLQGIAHHYAGRYAQALDRFQRMEQAAEKLDRKKDVAAALNYQGYQYRSMLEWDRAKQITLRALRILQSLPEDGNLANTYSGLGTIYFDLHQLDSALLLQRKAVELHERLGYAYLAAMCRMDISEVHNLRFQFSEAFEQLRLARPFLMEGGSPPDQVIFLYHETRALMGLGRLAEALRSAEQCHALALAVGNDEYRFRSLELQALLASAQGRHGDAMELQDSARTALTKSLDLAKAQELTEVRLSAEHEREAAKAQLLLDEEKRQKRNTLFGGGLVALIALLLLGFLITARRNAALLRAKNEEILRAQGQVVEAERQRENEQVRTRIARDIHDDLGSGLTKITMLGSDAKHKLNAASEDIRASLDRIIGHSREVSAALSDIVWTVDPLHDVSTELVTHARSVTERLLSDTGVETTLEFLHEGPDFPVSPGSKHHVMMVLKEAVNNALKYANARRITVSLLVGDARFKLRITDDGEGFDPIAKALDGNGLRNMRKRAEAIGATLAVTASPGAGCSVALEGTLR